MRLPFTQIAKKPTFALTGTSELTILAEIINNPASSEPDLKIISSSEGSPDDEVTIHRLLSSVSSRKGTVSVALPLYFFTTMTVSLPVMPEEAIGKAIPYHLAKTLTKPLQDFIYDWQITRKKKDHLEITAYLFPASVFNNMRSELARKQLDLKYLEPDVFAAFSYLNLTGKISDKEASLCSLVWPDHSSHAIYENGQLKLVRSVAANPPSTPFSMEQDDPKDDNKGLIFESEPITDDEGSVKDNEISMPDDHSILSDFSLSAKDEKEAPVAPVEALSMPEEEEIPPETEEGFDAESFSVEKDYSWPEYINSLGLEMIRTKDFFASIMKGSELKKAFAGGATPFIGEISNVTRSTINSDLAPLTDNPGTDECSDLLHAICIGTASR